MTKVVHKGKDEFDIYIGRPSKWGNPYSHKDDTIAEYKVATRDEAIRNYKHHILSSPSLLNDLHELRGNILGCWCKPSSCHGDVLVELLEKGYDRGSLRVGVVGSRDYDNYEAVKSILDRIAVRLIVSGGAKGADWLGERYANENSIPKLIFPAEWEKYGRGAGFIRNTDIVKNSDVVLSFWDGESRGTQDTMRKCIKMGVPLKIILPDGSIGRFPT